MDNSIPLIVYITRCRHTLLTHLWITLWIRGVKAVDNPVDKNVDKSGLWITRELSTGYPQGGGSYPQIYPQAPWLVSRLSKGISRVIHTIHSPY